MTTCPRCGVPVAPGTPSCPRCGAVFGPPPGNDQTMPPWMRQIQSTQQGPGGYGVGPRPATPMGSAPAGQQQPPTFSVGSLVSEDALPQWIRGSGEPTGIPVPAGPPQGMGGPAASQWRQAAPPDAAPGGWGAPAPGAAAPQASLGGANFVAPGGLSGSALFDDAALPEWLRNAASDRSFGGGPGFGQGAPPPGMSGGYPRPQQPQGMFMPSGWSADSSAVPFGPAGGYGAPPGVNPGAPAPGTMSAASLLDASALPTWLGGGGASAAMPGGAPTALGGEGVSAHSLVDERSLPVWLRQEPATPAVEPPPAGSISQWLSAPVTDEPLPTWLNQVYSSAQVPRVQADPPLQEPWTASQVAVVAGAQPRWYRPAVGQGTPASEPLMDDRPIPDWSKYPNAPASPAASFAPDASYSAAGAPGSYGAQGMGSFGGAAQSPSAALAPSESTWGQPNPSGPVGPSGPSGWDSPPGLASDDPVAAFSASDLIDPEALPPWVQREDAQEAPTFSSATGWTSKGRSADAAGHAAFGSPAQPTSDQLYGGGPAMAPGRDAGEANLPPWLQQGAPAHAAGNSGRMPARGPIPDTELPPWLRGPDAGAGAPQQAQQAQQAWGAPNMAYSPPQPAGPTGAGQAWGGPPPGNVPEQHYADLFSDERPGANRRFSYEEDHAQQQAYDGDPFDEDWDEPVQTPTKSRRRWFGRR